MGGAGDIQLLVIADDLTGSNDAGAQFAKRGIPGLVLVSADLHELPRGCPVVVVNTESRHVPAGEAARRVAQVARLGVEAGIPHIFKKTDSTLRGNIGAELKALLTATGARCLPFVPAFPEMGRTTRDGIHFVHGVPIGESEFANDPLSPVRKSEVAAVLRATADLRVANMKAAARNLPGDVDCVVVDCETRAELGQIATMLRDAGCAGVLAGSAAFAEELPKILDLRGRAATTVRARPPILFVNGSLNPRALEQVRVAAELFQMVRLTPGQLLGAESIQAEIWGANDVMLCSVRDRAELRNYQLKATELGMDAHALHQKVAEAHGRLVREILDSRKFGTLVIFGGDTLMGIAQAMGWTAFVPGGEVEAGVTVATPQGMDLVVVSKAGGFGDADVLRRIHAWVHTGAR